MTSYIALWLVGLLALCYGALADGCVNVTINNAADAEATRKNCRVIQGDLTLACCISEAINLDGIEVVEGSLHAGCSGFPNACTSVSEHLTISSSTLTTINQSAVFSWSNGLKELVLPNLTTVGYTLMLGRMTNLTHLDLTALSYVGSVQLNAPKLKTLLLDGLKGFTGLPGYGGRGSNGVISILDAGAVESVDGFFKNPLDPVFDSLKSEEMSIRLGTQNIQHVKNLTFGWAKVPRLHLAGVDLTVTLGGPSSESMEIGSLTLDKGVIALERGSKLNNLTGTTFELTRDSGLKDLVVPFDQLANFSAISVGSLRSLELLKAAEDWQNFGLDISYCDALNLTSEYTVDSAGKSRKSWYWPKGDMRYLRVQGDVHNGFFDSFVQSRKETDTVIETFTVVSTSSDFSCDVFDEMERDKDIVSDHYQCYLNREDSAAGLVRNSMSLQHPWTIALLAMGLFAPLL